MNAEQNFKTNQADGIAVSNANAKLEWNDPERIPAPRGCKLQLLTKGLVCVHGNWQDRAGFIAWAPLLKVPQWVHDKLENDSVLNNLNKRSSYER